MKHFASRLSTAAIVIGLGAFLAAATPAAAQTLYGIAYVGDDGPATFYTIDPATGAATVVGAVGFERCSGMDFSPGGVLFATCERIGTSVPVLVTINPATGAGTEVGPTINTSGAVTDLAFRADGTLFAYDGTNSPGHHLATINTTTGTSTVVGATGLSFAGGNAISFSAGGTLYHSQFSGGPNPDLNTLNTTTGAATFVSQILPVTGRFTAMDIQPGTGTLYAILNDGSSGGGPSSLATINPVGGTATVIGLTTNGMDALAWSPATIVPTPTAGPLGLALLAGLLALVAGLVMRRM